MRRKVLQEGGSQILPVLLGWGPVKYQQRSPPWETSLPNSHCFQWYRFISWGLTVKDWANTSRNCWEKPLCFFFSLICVGAYNPEFYMVYTSNSPCILDVLIAPLTAGDSYSEMLVDTLNFCNSFLVDKHRNWEVWLPDPPQSLGFNFIAPTSKESPWTSGLAGKARKGYQEGIDYMAQWLRKTSGRSESWLLVSESVYFFNPMVF